MGNSLAHKREQIEKSNLKDMSTILFHDIVFGPIKSRRLGASLGMNLLPRYGKICNFDCVYCECGWNKDGRNDSELPSKELVAEALEDKLIKLRDSGEKIDTITFSGNGEPTLHPDFPWIIDKTISLRDTYYPETKISVLTNATNIGKKEIFEALSKIDNPILKIDSCYEGMIKLINKPQGAYSLEEIIESIRKFNGNFILQTMFLKGTIDGQKVDMTSPEMVEGWRNLVRELKPREIMAYTLDRETPLKSLEKISLQELNDIVAPLIEEGYKVIISG